MDNATPSCRLVTVKELSKLLQLHQRTIWRLSGLAEAGLNDFPRPLRLGPKSVRWRLSDIEAYIDSLAGGRVDHGA